MATDQTVDEKVPYVVVEVDAAPTVLGTYTTRRWVVVNGQGEVVGTPSTFAAAARDAGNMMWWHWWSLRDADYRDFLIRR